MMDETIKKFHTAFDGVTNEYRPIPFWSWNNELTEEELVKQIVEFQKVGIGGFIIHARMGLTIEYLGEKWFSCVDACLKKAKELGLRVWIYDENGFPSGFVGGKLLKNENYLAQFLRYQILNEFDENAFCVYKKTDDSYVRITQKCADIVEYHTLYRLKSPSNVDILNPEVVDAFIKETHERYFEAFKESFGKELVGFFTDEPQYYRNETPYTPIAEAIYSNRFGGDVRDGLIYLFLNDEKGYAFRTRYYSILNELYVTNFYKKLYDWCEAHGCQLTGHSVEEPFLYTQMWGGGACMPTYEYEHIPAVDCLERNCGTELAPKQVGSVASQLGHKFVLTETFGCSGYDVTPKELKSLGDFQYFNGVNLLCHHLTPYSIAGQGKYDYPPVFSKHNNWWNEFKEFNEYFTRLGYLIANTTENYDVLIVHPMRSVWLDYIRTEDRKSVAELEKSFAELLQLFRKHGIQYQLADERILSRYGKALGDTLTIGKREYHTVIVPDMRTIAAATYSLLKKFTGKQCYLGEISFIDGERKTVDLSSNISLDEILESGRLKFSCKDGLSGITSRFGELGEFVFIKNYSRTEPSRALLKGAKGNYRALDLITLTVKPIEDELEIEPCGSLILLKNNRPLPQKTCVKTENITKNFHTEKITPNSFVLDNGSFSCDGARFSDEMPLPQLFEKLLREDYKGKVYIRHTFRLNERVPLRLEMEKGRVFYAAVNGREIAFSQSDFDMNFVETNLFDELVIGENDFVYGMDYYQHDGVCFALFDELATESLRTGLYYDTHIENVYLHGEFVVNGDFSLSKRTALPPVSSKNYQNGYPFFFGEIVISGNYNYDGIGERELCLKGRYVSAVLSAGGKERAFVLSEKIDVTDLLRKGDNPITIRVKSSLRNLFGPHHCGVIDEPMGVSPATFTMRGEWKDGLSKYFTYKYNSVPFGVDRIEITTIK